jgi:predicted GNAT family acetyltransferase
VSIGKVCSQGVWNVGGDLVYVTGRAEGQMEILNIEVVNNEAEQRFEAHVQGQTAFLAYRRFPDRLVLVHTEVPPALEGKGIAGKLVARALDLARAAHLRVIPLCPYVTSFVRKHPEYHDLLSPEDHSQILAAEPHTEDAGTQRADSLRLMAFYEIARRANLASHPELMRSPVFQKAKELYESRAKYLWEGFQSQEAVNDYFKFHLEGALASEGKSWEDAWAEFAPESLKSFPLAPGALL